MKKLLVLILAALMILTAAACGGGDKKAAAKQESAGVDKLVEEYGFQWQDTKAPILNEKGAKELSFSIYSSKNASALDYNDMKIMQDLYASTNVFVSWENVSESVYSQQKNLIFGNADNRPDAIYHAGMGAGEIIKYAKRKVLLPISDYLEYMPNFSKILEERPDIKNQLINVEDGKIYSLPRIEEMGLLQNPNILFLNKNWAKAAIEAGAVTGVTADDLKDGLNLKADQMEAMLRYFLLPRQRHERQRQDRRRAPPELRVQQLAGQSVRPVRHVRPQRQPGAPGHRGRQGHLHRAGRATARAWRPTAPSTGGRARPSSPIPRTTSSATPSLGLTAIRLCASPTTPK